MNAEATDPGAKPDSMTEPDLPEMTFVSEHAHHAGLVRAFKAGVEWWEI